jgi:hypothetical protein
VVLQLAGVAVCALVLVFLRFEARFWGNSLFVWRRSAAWAYALYSVLAALLALAIAAGLQLHFSLADGRDAKTWNNIFRVLLCGLSSTTVLSKFAPLLEPIGLVAGIQSKAMASIGKAIKDRDKQKALEANAKRSSEVWDLVAHLTWGSHGETLVAACVDLTTDANDLHEQALTAYANIVKSNIADERKMRTLAAKLDEVFGRNVLRKGIAEI